MLICDNLASTRWGRALFKGLGFCLPQGSLLVVTGGGKHAGDALLRILAGEKKPHRGAVRFEGSSVLHNAEYKSILHHIEADATVKPRLTVERHIADSSADTGLAQAAMRYFKLTPHAGTPCGQLPRHLRQRVTLAPLLATPRPLWLLPHPALSLDEEGADLLYALISQRCNQDGIVVMTAADSGFITPCQRIMLNDFQ